MERMQVEDLYNFRVLAPYDEVFSLVTPEWIAEHPYLWYDRVMHDLKGHNHKNLLDKYVSLGMAAQVRPLLQIVSKTLDLHTSKNLENQAGAHALRIFKGTASDNYDMVLVELIKWKPFQLASIGDIVLRALSKHTVFTQFAFSTILAGQQSLVLSIVNTYRKTRVPSAKKINLYRVFEAMVSNSGIVEPYFREAGDNWLLAYHKNALDTILALDLFILLEAILDQPSELSNYIKGSTFNSKAASISITKILRDNGLNVVGPVYASIKKGTGRRKLPNTRNKELRTLTGKDHDDVIKALDTGIWPNSDLQGTSIQVRISGPSGSRSLYLRYGQVIGNYDLIWNPTSTLGDYLKAFKPSPIETISVHAPQTNVY